MHTVPTTLPVGIGEKGPQDFRVKIALALEITVEPPVREPGTGHDLLERDILETISIEQFPGTLNDVLLYLHAMSGRIRHSSSIRIVRRYGEGVCLGYVLVASKNIILNIFWIRASMPKLRAVPQLLLETKSRRK